MHRHNYQRTEGIRAETTNNALIIVTYTEMLLHLERSYLSNIKLEILRGYFHVGRFTCNDTTADFFIVNAFFPRRK